MTLREALEKSLEDGFWSARDREQGLTIQNLLEEYDEAALEREVVMVDDAPYRWIYLGHEKDGKSIRSTEPYLRLHPKAPKRDHNGSIMAMISADDLMWLLRATTFLIDTAKRDPDALPTNWLEGIEQLHSVDKYLHSFE